MMTESQREKLRNDPVGYWKNYRRLRKAWRKLDVNTVLFKIKLRSEDKYKACVKKNCGEIIYDIWPALGTTEEEIKHIKAMYEELD